MKNVAGYDVSRLRCGALGTLGVIVEVSLRLLPQPRGQRTLGWQCDAQEALAIMREARARPLPCTGACWFDDTLFLRLTGDAPALDAAQSQLPGGCSETADGPWAALRDCTLPAQQGPGLWALSVAPATPLDGGPPALLDWAGARRYYRGRQAQEMHAMASAGSGHAWRLGGGEDDDDVLAAPPTPLATLQLRLKQALDPARILNRGRLYRWH